MTKEMTMPGKHSFSAVMIATAFGLWTAPAQAGIDCKGGFQRVEGSYLATPYCQDALLAVVARQYGMKASAAAIRENPNYKRTVCRLVGRDIRVHETCILVEPGRGRGL
jgi:hypothetical protein